MILSCQQCTIWAAAHRAFSSFHMRNHLSGTRSAMQAALWLILSDGTLDRGNLATFAMPQTPPAPCDLDAPLFAFSVLRACHSLQFGKDQTTISAAVLALH